MDSNKLGIFIDMKVELVSRTGYIWIGPWVIFPQYMDQAFFHADNEKGKKQMLFYLYSHLY